MYNNYDDDITGSEAGPTDRNHSERHLEGVYGAQHIHLPTRVLNEDHWRHLRVYLPG